ncbi:MAG TPA: ATP-binding cassette domain-containing protein [Trueperaceae bacterium]|nr:ATP-binding cassette domain-containing protein [Trueperaceae bacterium]
MTTPPLVRVDGVTKRFTTVLAVDDLSFEVRPGEIFALLGPNGAGKSTTVRMLAGITQPDSGSLTFDLGGHAPTSTVDPATLGYLPEERGLYPDQRVLPTLEYFASLRGIERDTARQRAAEWLDRFGLGERSNDKVNSLSKGNQQKVQFIASVQHRPLLAVLDEPFSGFDPVNQDLVSTMIRDLRAEGMTVILSAHHMDLVESLADYILLMHKGRSVLRGSMAEIRASSGMGERLEITLAGPVDEGLLAGVNGVERVLSSTANTARLALSSDARVGRVLHELTGTVDVVDVTTGAPSLREIYLAAVSEPGAAVA